MEIPLPIGCWTGCPCLGFAVDGPTGIAQMILSIPCLFGIAILAVIPCKFAVSCL